MPSFTTFVRLEPRPRAPSLVGTLAARVRDPAWMLSRQWQCGEFTGEDAGGPAFARIETTVCNVRGWRRGPGQPLKTLDGLPLEPAATGEPFLPDLSVRAELGQVMIDLQRSRLKTARIAEATALSILLGLVRAHPLPPAYGDLGPPLFTLPAGLASQLDRTGPLQPEIKKEFERAGIVLAGEALAQRVDARRWNLVETALGRTFQIDATDSRLLEVRLSPVGGLGDVNAKTFLSVCGGRTPDGVTVFRAARRGLPLMPISAARGRAFELAEAGKELIAWVEEVYGEIAEADAPAWQPMHLNYELELVTDCPAGGTAIFSAEPGLDGDLEWYNFDFVAKEDGGTKARHETHSVIPGHVRAAALPSPRWWDFESSRAPIGEITPDKTDLAKLILAHFILVQGNDWFVMPFDRGVGTVTRIDALVVRDVFGFETRIPRADAAYAKDGWTLFSTSASERSIADFFLVPPTAASAAQFGPVREEVEFRKDDAGNMVWAVERKIEDAVGESVDALRFIDETRAQTAPVPRPPSPDATLTYILQTTLPANWFPFLYVLQKQKRREQTRVLLERALQPGPDGIPLQPIGQILRPIDLSDGRYFIAEQEVPREGLLVARVAVRTRCSDGSARIWVTRRRTLGTRAGASDLRFDLAVTPDWLGEPAR